MGLDMMQDVKVSINFTNLKKLTLDELSHHMGFIVVLKLGDIKSRFILIFRKNMSE